MSGSPSKPKIPPTPAPTPQPVMGREEGEAKTKVRSRRGGRQSTIFAGKLNSSRNTILNTKLG